MKMLQYYIVVKSLALYIGVCISSRTGYVVVSVPYDPSSATPACQQSISLLRHGIEDLSITPMFINMSFILGVDAELLL